MRRISAQYLFTSSGKPLKRGVITVSDDNTIVSVEDTGGDLSESAGTEFYNGIIIPGLVNCHCHLELSHMKDALPAGTGLADFVMAVRERRAVESNVVASAALAADAEMLSEGIVLCGDISNNALTFNVKRNSSINYITFIEVFGINPSGAQERIGEALDVAAAAAAAGLPHHITPHAVYSVSQTLFGLLQKRISPVSLTSLHYLESADERELVGRRRGHLAESYRVFGVTPDKLDTPGNHTDTALTLARQTGQLILVHNTCITDDEARLLGEAGNIWFCLCPSSNLHISGTLPPVNMLRKYGDHIVAGTDSLASSGRLSILHELRLLHEAAPAIPLEEIINWGTISGARALQMSDKLGSLEPGKKPGLLLVEPVDLTAMRLLPQSRVRILL